MFHDRQIKIVVCISIVIALILIVTIIFNSFKNSKLKKDENVGPILSLTTDSNIFKIDSVTIFSSANALNNSEMQQSYWDLNLYQFNDLAIDIDNNVSIDGTTLKNTIKELYIDNISYPKYPNQGTPKLYLKSSSLFGKGIIDPENLIDNRIDFDVVASNDYAVNSNSFYADCSNPILLSSINEAILPNFIIRNTKTSVSFDGNLLLDATILLSNIEYSVSFSIHIINQLDEEYICTVSIPIVLSDASDIDSIYDGSYKVVLTSLAENKFYKRTN